MSTFDNLSTSANLRPLTIVMIATTLSGLSHVHRTSGSAAAWWAGVVLLVLVWAMVLWRFQLGSG